MYNNLPSQKQSKEPRSVLKTGYLVTIHRPGRAQTQHGWVWAYSTWPGKRRRGRCPLLPFSCISLFLVGDPLYLPACAKLDLIHRGARETLEVLRFPPQPAGSCSEEHRQQSTSDPEEDFRLTIPDLTWAVVWIPVHRKVSLLGRFLEACPWAQTLCYTTSDGFSVWSPVITINSKSLRFFLPSLPLSPLPYRHRVSLCTPG